jgi:putative ABC transport system permease protein
LIGAPVTRITAMVMQQAWLIGAIGYAIAVAVGSQAFPHFPRRVVLTPWTIGGVGLLVLVVSTLASILGVVHALRIDPGRALEA